jgi:hypothetical protein
VSDQTITQLSAISALDDDDLMVVVEDGTAKKVTVAQLRSALGVPFYTSTLGGDTANFDITSIPAGGSYLEIVADLRGTESAVQSDVCVRFNNDSGTNYQGQLWYFIPSAQAGQPGSNNVADDEMRIGMVAGATSVAGNSGAVRIIIPNYAGTTFRKQLRAQTAYSREAGNDPAATLGTGLWESTAAITRVTVYPGSGSWKAGSFLACYVRP